MKVRLMFLLAGATLSLTLAQDWLPGRDEAYDSLPPNVRYYCELKAHPELKRRSFDDPESLNCRLVGKWGRGPAVKVTGRDSLVFLSLGSEVAVFNCADGSNPRIITEIQCRGIVSRSILKDSLLYVIQRGALEVFNIRDVTQPTRVSYIRQSMIDMAIEDSLAYVIDDESLWVYSIAQPGNLRRLGACRDSGYSIFADSGFAYVCDRWGLYIIDCTDPARPHRATTLTGAQSGAAWVENGYCYYTELSASPAALCIADVRDPYHPVGVGRRNGSASYDLYKLDYFLYMPNYCIFDVSNPSWPTLIAGLQYDGFGDGVWTRSPFSYSFVAAGPVGLGAVNIVDPVHPFVDTAVAGAHEAIDVCADGTWAYVADYYAGMKVLDVASPAAPYQVGSYDSVGQSPRAVCVVTCDSFAFLGTDALGPAGFRVLDVSQRDRPVLASVLPSPNWAGAVVLRDSLVYFAIDLQLRIISIANPRAPRLVGSCGLPNSSWGLSVKDSLAFVANLTSLKIVNVANPALPVVIGSWAIGRHVFGVAVRDSIAYVAGDFGLYSLSVVDPASPILIDSITFPNEADLDVALLGSLAFTGTTLNSASDRLRVIDISDPANMRSIGFYDAPDAVRRVVVDSNLVYAACTRGGVCIFETTSTAGVAERPALPMTDAQFGVQLDANPVRSVVELNLSGLAPGPVRVGFFDVAGREVKTMQFMATRQSGRLTTNVDLTDLPRGVLLLTARQGNRSRTLKLIRP